MQTIAKIPCVSYTWYFIIAIISGLHHYECTVPLITNNLQSRWFCAVLTASVSVRLWDSRSFRTVFIHVIWGRPRPSNCLAGVHEFNYKVGFLLKKKWKNICCTFYCVSYFWSQFQFLLIMCVHIWQRFYC